jgi:hypothetical protein
MKKTLLLFALLGMLNARVNAATVLVEAETFARHGGWKLDTQFIEIMGSPYLLAHGLGRPVADATTTIDLREGGTYRVWARTKDWVARWKAPGTPGRFQVLINDRPLATEFGTKGANWDWQDGGTVTLPAGRTRLALRDLTGFDGRCDAILLSTDKDFSPPAGSEPMAEWRTKLAGLPREPEEMGSFDLVVVGGGYGGLGSAISAARMGCKVALIQNRPVLGGNGSSEIRVWAKGGTRRGEFDMLGEIVEEFADFAKASPGTHEEFGDAKKEEVVRAEKNISLFLNHHGFRVEKSGREISAVLAFDTRTGRIRRFAGRLFADCTGHGLVGIWAGADHTLRMKDHLGMSNMWRWENADSPQSFPDVPWALNLGMEDFPYPRRFHGEWFWESGYDLDPLKDLEHVRDWNLRAVYGAFSAMKKSPEAAAEHRNARLAWIAYVGGTRESTQLLGDVILTQDDIVNQREFPDGTVPTTWSIDLHYPKEQYAKKFPDNPFISKAVHGKGVDRRRGYPLPYRSFYSRNVENLFMAGRNISVTHEALGTIRVMRTGGMIGEVVGKAASICLKHDCLPAAVYHSHLEELLGLCRLPGVTRRDTVRGELYVAKDAAQLPPPEVTWNDPSKLPGLVLDDLKAEHVGDWKSGQGLKGFFGESYRYASGNSGARATYRFKIEKAGRYDVRFGYQHHPNRASNAGVVVRHARGEDTVPVNLKLEPPLKPTFLSLGVFEFAPGQPAEIEIVAKAVDGNVHSDIVQLLPAP